MVETSASFISRAKQSFQSFGLVLFSFVADITSIIIATQQQQVGRLGFGILAAFLSALAILQILTITWRISTIRRSAWPLMVGIVFSSGILALCSRIWSGDDWWQWVLMSLVIPVASLVFITWMYGRTDREWKSPFTFDYLGHWFGFVALGFAADVVAIVGAITSPEFRIIFVAAALALTSIVVALFLFITHRESKASSQSGPLIVGLFSSAGLAVAFLYIWIDKALWDALAVNMLIASLAIIIGLLRCPMNESDFPTPLANPSLPHGNPKRMSIKGRQGSPNVGVPEASDNRHSETNKAPGIRHPRRDGGNFGGSFGLGNPESPPPHYPGSPPLGKPMVPEVEPLTNTTDHLQPVIPGLEHLAAPNTLKNDAVVDLGKIRYGELSDAMVDHPGSHEPTQGSSAVSFFEVVKPEVNTPEQGSFLQPVLHPSLGKSSVTSLEKRKSLFSSWPKPSLDLKDVSLLDLSQKKVLSPYFPPNTMQPAVNLVSIWAIIKKGLVEDMVSGFVGVRDKTEEPQIRIKPFNPLAEATPGYRPAKLEVDKGESVVQPKDIMQPLVLILPFQFPPVLPGNENQTLTAGSKGPPEETPMNVGVSGVQIPAVRPQAQEGAPDLHAEIRKLSGGLAEHAPQLEERSEGDGDIGYKPMVEVMQGDKLLAPDFLPEQSTIPVGFYDVDSSAITYSVDNLDSLLGKQSNVIGTMVPPVKPADIELPKPLDGGQLDKGTPSLPEPRSIKQDGNSK